MSTGMLQGQFQKLLNCLKFANFGNFLHRKVSTYGNFWKQLQGLELPISDSIKVPILVTLVWLLSNQKMVLKSIQTWQKHTFFIKDDDKIDYGI